MIGKKETVFAEGAVFVKQPRTFSCRERFYNDPSRANSDIRQKGWCATFTFRSFFHSNLIATKHSSIVRARTKISFEDVSEKKKKKNSNNEPIRTERGWWTRRKNRRVFGSGLASKMLFYPDNGSNAGSESVARRSVRWRSRVLRRGYEARFIIDARGVLPTSRRHNIVA